VQSDESKGMNSTKLKKAGEKFRRTEQKCVEGSLDYYTAFWMRANSSSVRPLRCDAGHVVTLPSECPDSSR
jgi:hypothetical protein